MSGVDVRGILESAGADPQAPEGSQAWALAQVDAAVAELIKQRNQFRAVTEKVAFLNPDAGEIGEGMLRQLVTAARGAVIEAGVADRDALARVQVGQP